MRQALSTMPGSIPITQCGDNYETRGTKRDNRQAPIVEILSIDVGYHPLFVWTWSNLFINTQHGKAFNY